MESKISALPPLPCVERGNARDQGAEQMTPLGAALAYAALGWCIFPVGTNKRPLTQHGRSDAVRDPERLSAWWCGWPHALAAVATGAESGIVAVDIDVSPSVNGFDGLDALGASILPVTAMAHTPRGGLHLIFRHPGPGQHVKTIAGKLGPGIDIRGDGGSLTLPPGPGRYWDPILGPYTPLAPFPEWAVIPEPPAPRIDRSARPVGTLSKYGEAALDSAVRAIVSAGAGCQEVTLNRECFAIAQLVGGGVIPSGLALRALRWAAYQMPSTDRRRPWQSASLDRKVDTAFLAGLRDPRRAANG